MFLKNKNGSLLFIVFLLILFAFIGSMIVSLLSSTSTSSSEEFVSTQSFYLAESGREIAIEECLKNSTCSGNQTYYLGNGEIKTNFLQNTSITLDNGTSAALYTTASEGIINNIKREIEFKFWK